MSTQTDGDITSARLDVTSTYGDVVYGASTFSNYILVYGDDGTGSTALYVRSRDVDEDKYPVSVEHLQAVECSERRVNGLLKTNSVKPAMVRRMFRSRATYI